MYISRGSVTLIRTRSCDGLAAYHVSKRLSKREAKSRYCVTRLLPASTTTYEYVVLSDEKTRPPTLVYVDESRVPPAPSEMSVSSILKN